MSLSRDLGEFTLKCAAMHVEDSSGGRDIAIVLIKHSLDVLPLKAANR